MAGSRLLTRMAAKKRLILLFSTVFVLFVARLGVADESDPPRLTPNSVEFAEFLEFESLAHGVIRTERAPGCSAAPPKTASGASIKPMLSGLPVAFPRAEARPQMDGPIVLSNTGYNYQRHR